MLRHIYNTLEFVKIRNYYLSAMPPIVLTSLVKAWAEMKPPPVGILDQLVSHLFSKNSPQS